MGETPKAIFSSSQQGLAPFIDEATPVCRRDARRADPDSVGLRGPGDAERSIDFLCGISEDKRFLPEMGGELPVELQQPERI